MFKVHMPYGDKPPRRASEPGKRMQPHYVERYTETGHPYLVKDGETDTYEIIQSHKMECDINILMQRYAAGDNSVINKAAVYADISNLPTNFVDMMNYMKAQQERFAALPAEIKQKFDNSFEVWATAAGTENWLEKMGLMEQAEAQKEVKQDGQQE